MKRYETTKETLNAAEFNLHECIRNLDINGDGIDALRHYIHELVTKCVNYEKTVAERVVDTLDNTDYPSDAAELYGFTLACQKISKNFDRIFGNLTK